MLSIKLVVNILVGCAFVFLCLANISTTRKKTMKYMWVYAIVSILGLGILSYGKPTPAQNNYFISFVIIWPSLISRIYIQHRIKSPVEFMNRKMDASLVITRLVVLAFIAFFTLMVLQPNRINYETGEGIYNDKDVQYKISFLFFVIAGGLLFFILFLQRTAFCANGLLYQGLLLDWSNFKSYKWEKDEFYSDADVYSLLDKDSVIELTLYADFRMPFTPAKFQFVVPYIDKEVIEKILKPVFPSR